MKSNFYAFLFVILCLNLWLGCSDSNSSSKIKNGVANKLIITDSKVKFVENNKFIMIDTFRFPVPPGTLITAENIYNGIYEIRGNSLNRHKYIFNNNYVFLTTSEDLGRGIRSYLYVFNIRNKSLIKDMHFKRNFLYSSAGVFVIDPRINRIFIIGRPSLYEAKQSLITPGSIYNLKSDHFKFEKNVFKFGELQLADSSFLSFFNKAQKQKDNEVFDLPNDWFKSN